MKYIYILIVSAFFLASHGMAWGMSLEYKLGLLGYGKKEISDIVSGRKTRRQVDLECMRKMLGLPSVKTSPVFYLTNQGSEKISMGIGKRPFLKNSCVSARQKTPKFKDKNELLTKAMPYLPIIRRAGTKNGIRQSLILAVIKVESDFNPRAVSPKGAMGLMQLMPNTASDLALTNPFDPRQNINNGTKYLSSCLKMFNTADLALAAYNAGPGLVAKLKKIPPFRETQYYVKNVLKYEKEYDRLIKGL